MDQNRVNELKTLVEQAKSVLILPRERAEVDELAASLALYLSLKKAGREALVVLGRPITAGEAVMGLVGIDRIQSEIANKNLVVRIKTPGHPRDYINKISYDQKVEESALELLIEPHANFAPLTKDKLEFYNQGTTADLIFVIGAQNLGQLGGVYERNKELFSGIDVINMDYIKENQDFGKVNLVFPKAVSNSEIVAYVLSSLKLPVDQDIAGNIYKGIVEATDYFQKDVAASTFEAAAFSLRSGAAVVSRAAGQDKRTIGIATNQDKAPHPANSDWPIYRAGEQKETVDPGGTVESKASLTGGSWPTREAVLNRHLREKRGLRRKDKSDRLKGPRVYTGGEGVSKR